MYYKFIPLPYDKSKSIPTASCLLPSFVTSHLGLTEEDHHKMMMKRTILKVTYTIDHEDFELFIMWNGEISLKYPDCIEILLDDTNLSFNSIYTGKIEKVNQNKIALEVYLAPDSIYDWEIICKQPYSLEQSVLKQVVFSHIFYNILSKIFFL